MGGGKSESSSQANQTSITETASATATGTVGDVVQGTEVTIHNELPDSVVNVFEQLVALSGNAIDTAASAGQKALDATNYLAQTTKQPDVTLIQGYQKQVYYLIGAVGIVTLLVLFRKK